MCDDFEELETSMRLSKSIMYSMWTPGTPLPAALPQEIIRKLNSITTPIPATATTASIVATGRVKLQAPLVTGPCADFLQILRGKHAQLLKAQSDELRASLEVWCETHAYMHTYIHKFIHHIDLKSLIGIAFP